MWIPVAGFLTVSNPDIKRILDDKKYLSWIYGIWQALAIIGIIILMQYPHVGK